MTIMLPPCRRTTLFRFLLCLLVSGFAIPSVFAQAPPDSMQTDPNSLQFVRAQFVHNSADPALAVVDVYADSTLLIDDFAYRSATPYLDLPADSLNPLTFGFAPADSDSVDDVFATVPHVIVPGHTFQLVIVGVMDPAAYAPNPQGRSTRLTIVKNANASEMDVANPDRYFVSFIHAVTDLPAVRVRFNDATLNSPYEVLADSVLYTGFAGYKPFMPTTYNVQMRARSDSRLLDSFLMDLTGLSNGTATLVPSGFLNPQANAQGPALELLLVQNDGTVRGLLVNTSAEEDVQPGAFRLRENYLNPFNPSTSLRFDLDQPARVHVDVFDVAGRRVLQLPAQPFAAGAGQTLRLDAAALPSGVYLYRLTAETVTERHVATGRMVLAK